MISGLSEEAPMSTLGHLINRGDTLYACCYACQRTVEMDLAALAARLGREHSAMHDGLTPRLKCSACGSRNVGLRISPTRAIREMGKR